MLPISPHFEWRMADYYPLIARAIAGLDPSAPGESRRALYERARAALIQQLRSVQPPLSESEITRERLSLEEAVRKVEAEAAQRARDASRAGGARPRRRRFPPRQRPPAGNRRRAARRPRRGPARRHRRRARSATVRSAQGASAPPRNLRPTPPRPQRPQPPTPDPQLPPTRERPARPRRGPMTPRRRCRSRRGMRGFRDIAADADDLGRAAAQANRNARKTYANVPSPSPEFDRLEPSMENRGADPDQPYSYDESIEEAERYTPPGRRRCRRRHARRGSAAAIARSRSAPASARCFRSRARSRSASF